jgi:hypothetical protein
MNVSYSPSASAVDGVVFLRACVRRHGGKRTESKVMTSAYMRVSVFLFVFPISPRGVRAFGRCKSCSKPRQQLQRSKSYDVSHQSWDLRACLHNSYFISHLLPGSGSIQRVLQVGFCERLSGLICEITPRTVCTPCNHPDPAPQ